MTCPSILSRAYHISRDCAQAWLLERAHIRERLVQNLVASRDHTGDRAGRWNRGPYPDQVVTRTIRPGDSPAGEDDIAAGRKADLCNVSIAAGGGGAHDGAEVMVLDQAHHRFGVADGSGPGEERDAAADVRLEDRHAPAFEAPGA